MKNIISITLFLLFIVITNAQEVKPKFEKQNGLTKATYYYDNGAIKEVGFFKNEKLHDKWISYNKEGDITTIAIYNNGKKDGKWYVVTNDSIKELTYKSNKLIKIKNVKGTELSYI
jgi:antitoxin component YwqK of YwqJK toxin-antitoxin module